MSTKCVKHSFYPDIAVLGAGPAASLAASRLAQGGRSVALIGRSDSRQRIEGASPRVMRLLQAHGLNSTAFAPPCQRYAQWGQMASAPNVENLVDRLLLDKDLLDMARHSGVEVVEADVQHIRGSGIQTSVGTLQARRIVDARGRRASAASGAVRGPATMACAGEINHWHMPHNGTELFATPMGWCWLAALPGAGVWAQIAIDASAAKGGKQALTRVWKAFFEQHVLMGSPWESLPMPASPLFRACELRLNAPELRTDCLRIGDAAVAFDPLSGHGLFWALSSALMLPPLLQALDDGQEALARRFYRARVTATFWRQARIARDFYALCPEWSKEPFWAKRCEWPDAIPAHAEQAAPVLDRKVVVEQGRLSETDVLLTPQEPDGVAFVMGQPLAPILKQLRESPLPQRREFATFVPQLSEPQAGTLHDWLLSRGLVVSSRLLQSPSAETQP